jgi:hypothetical protein
VSVALVLFGYAAIAFIAGPPLLSRTGWTSRTPRLGIGAWVAWLTSVLLAVVLGGLVLAVPTASVSHGLAELLRACVMALQAWYATPGGVIMASAGILLSAGVIGRMTVIESGDVGVEVLHTPGHTPERAAACDYWTPTTHV